LVDNKRETAGSGALASDRSRAAVAAGPQPSPWAVSAVRAFIVEDSALLLRDLSSVLQETSSVKVVASCVSEAAALKTLRKPPGAFDLIIIDLFLQSGSGLRVLRDARVLQPEARLVVLTNYATFDVRKRCVSLGADRIFDKSKQLDEFIEYCAAIAKPTGVTVSEGDEGPPTVPAGD
jgi:DNA-binding NarL/FixJ family response regulator